MERGKRHWEIQVKKGEKGKYDRKGIERGKIERERENGR
jgi:hypothetical protein